MLSCYKLFTSISNINPSYVMFSYPINLSSFHPNHHSFNNPNIFLDLDSPYSKLLNKCQFRCCFNYKSKCFDGISIRQFKVETEYHSCLIDPNIKPFTVSSKSTTDIQNILQQNIQNNDPYNVQDIYSNNIVALDFESSSDPDVIPNLIPNVYLSDDISFKTSYNPYNLSSSNKI